MIFCQDHWCCVYIFRSELDFFGSFSRHNRRIVFEQVKSTNRHRDMNWNLAIHKYKYKPWCLRRQSTVSHLQHCNPLDKKTLQSKSPRIKIRDSFTALHCYKCRYTYSTGTVAHQYHFDFKKQVNANSQSSHPSSPPQSLYFVSSSINNLAQAYNSNTNILE